MSKGLQSLPPEVLDEVTGNFESARTLISFSTASRRLKEYVDEHGYRAFVKGNFPAYDLPPQWEAAAQSLTGLTRCWEQRAFLARLVERENASDIINLAALSETAAAALQPPGPPQSMGCRTMLQCREEWTGGDWRSRKEALYIGAGSELRLRLRCMGPETDQSYLDTRIKDRARCFNHFGQRVHWTVFRDHAHKEGKCDITSVHPLPQESSEGKRVVLISRYCGNLERVTLDGKTAQKELVYKRSSSLRFADLSPSKQPLVAASNSLHGIRLIDPSPSDEPKESLDELSFASETPYSIVWSCRFLDAGRVVVGRESKQSPLGVYELTPTGFNKQALWEYPWEAGVLSCVKTIAPLRHANTNESHRSNLFLSGWMSNEVLLHDIRCPDSSVGSFSDPVDQTSNTYSLLPFGADKFIAGSDRHGLVRFFDMRMPGAHSYSSLDTAGTQSPYPNGKSDMEHQNPSGRPSPAAQAKLRRGFNLFIRDSHVHSWGMTRNGENGRRTRHQLRLKESPIYDLAASSQYASSFYAGLVGATLQVDLVSASDKWPDPTFSPSPGDEDITHPRTWLDPKGNALRLGLVEHSEKIELYTQAPLETTPFSDMRESSRIDPRWKSTTPGRLGQNFRSLAV